MNDYSELIREHKELNAALLPLEKVEVPGDLVEATRLHIRRICEKCIGNITKAASNKVHIRGCDSLPRLRQASRITVP